MTRLLAALALGCTGLALVACETAPTGPVFVAANSSTVIIDYARSDATQLDAAKAMATDKCKLFGNTSSVLESLNVLNSSRERASFLCK